MKGRIATVLLGFDSAGHITSEWLVDLSLDRLHEIYQTVKSYGLVSDGDLIGQTLEIQRENLHLYSSFIDIEEDSYIKSCNFLLHTYFKIDSDIELLMESQFSLCIYLKKKKKKNSIYLGEVNLYGFEDVKELRDVLKLPSGHSLVGDFPISLDWQFAYFKKYGIHFDFNLINIFLTTYKK